MPMIFTILDSLYILCALLLVLYTGSALLLLWAYWRRGPVVESLPAASEWPCVGVQLPVYNERHVVRGLLESIAALDYPREKLIVQVLDDSSDDTSSLIARLLPDLRAQGLDIRHLHRTDRQGYKAGALAWGLDQLDCDYVLLLDADFRPAPDFLRQTLPYLLADDSLGLVQARWGHLNSFDNALTLGQTLALDAHFVIEQAARNRAGWLMNFSGSAGLWRVECIRAAGGWQADTLTEDLDLSYRAQLAGWRFLYLPEVVVPAALPPQIAAYKHQQARWAQGSTQTLLRMVGPLWRSRLRLGQRLMATLHLCQYLPQPLMLLLLLLTPPLLLSGNQHMVALGPLGLLGLAPPLLYVVSQRAINPDWPRRLVAFPVLLVLGTGLAWNNSLAVLRALLGGQSPFERTPKFAADWSASAYALRLDRAVWGEIALTLYGLWAMNLARTRAPALLPYLLLYSLSFGLLAAWTLHDDWRIAHSQPAPQPRSRQDSAS